MFPAMWGNNPYIFLEFKRMIMAKEFLSNMKRKDLGVIYNDSDLLLLDWLFPMLITQIIIRLILGKIIKL